MKRFKINGPPGTGKTTFLMNLVKTAVESGRHDPRKIAFLSFSRAAAEEARSRILKVLPQYEPEDFPWFCTIHSACKTLLGVKTNQLFAGQNVKLFEEKTGISISDVPDDDLFVNTASYAKGDMCRSILSYQAHTGISLKESYIKANFRDLDFIYLEFFLKNLKRFKLPCGEHPRIYDFEDLLLEVLSNEMKIPCTLLIVDEAQDLSLLLFKIVEMWSERAQKVILTGDPYQAIYTFQGADPELLMECKVDAEATLDESFRCPSSIRSAARSIVSRMRNRYENDDFYPRVFGGEVRKVQAVDFGKVESGDRTVFILCRDNKSVNAHIAKMKRSGIPYGTIQNKKKPILNTQAAKTIVTIEKIRRDDKVTFDSYYSMLDYIKVQGNLERGAKARIKEMRANPDIILSDVSISDLPDYGWLETGIEGIRSGKIFNNLSGIRADTVEYVKLVLSKYGFDVIKKKPKLQIGTIHSAKGKEADVVVIDPSFPKKVKEEYATKPETEHRLAYVAVTRAKQAVYILPPFNRDYNHYYPYPIASDNEKFEDSGSRLDREKLISTILGIHKPSIVAYEEFDPFEEFDKDFDFAVGF